MVSHFCGAEEQSLATFLDSPRSIYSRSGFLNEKDPPFPTLSHLQKWSY